MNRASVFDKTDHNVFRTVDLDILFEKHLQGHA